MKIVVACEDTGALKVICAQHGTDTSKPVDESNPLAPVKISTHAEKDNSRKTRVLHLVQSQITKNIIVTRLDGSIEVYDTSKILNQDQKSSKNKDDEETEELLPQLYQYKQLIEPPTSSNSETFVNLIVDDIGRVLVPTSKGNVFIWTSEEKIAQKPHLCKVPLAKDEIIEAFQVHHGAENIDYVAYGGKETDLRIVKLPSLKKKGEEAEVVFKAKNMSNTRLELRVPIHIKNIVFAKDSSTNAFKLYTFTAVGDMRYYDSAAGRKPRSSVLILPKKAPITKAIWLGNHLVVCDNRGTVVKVEPSTGSQICQFKGQIGSIQALYNFNGTILGTSGSDRYVRAYNNETRDCIVKVFIGTQSNALAIIEDNESLKRHKANIIGDTALEAIKKKEAWEEKKLQEQEEEESDEEELWSKLESSITPRRKRRKLTLA